MHSQPNDEAEPGAGGTSWIVAAVGGGIGIAGTGLALAAFAFRTQHLVLTWRTLFALFGLLFLFAATVIALVRRLAPGGAEPTPPQSTRSNQEGEELTRRVRLLRGTDEL